MTTFGFIGLGAMGKPMARHLVQRGLAVTVFDSNAAAVDDLVGLGAARGATVRDVAENAEVVMACLPTPDIVEQVAIGAGGIAGAGAVKVFVDHSTTGPTVARKLAAVLQAHGIQALDAPLAGGVAGAEAGALTVMVSGHAGAFELARPALEAYGRNVSHLGEQPGLGQTLKLVNNMIAGSALVTAAEAVLFGVKAGIPAHAILQVLSKSATARGFAVETLLADKVLSRRFDFGFRMDLMRKDMRLVLSEAEAVGAPMFASAVVKQFFDAAVADGGANDDMTRVVQQIEKLAGATIGATGCQA
ncbi:NAD(P)-dependent oxidoreductase [Cupriavidus taiwanensis]|uniref:NAD(P)-dependent oxidoreductase n=1 Tax=Cupriavidus taiwanensis TaxID=164546 RepID=UPI000E105A5D|nr:NAD(P)-dependent oxidoreductase [Cupriavidus taiwanensis]SOY67248.1 3-hydroxyisobutyrate dehydrogenase [Cupriavidus taiwanensis]SOY67508.1 3-hydroxyisobutyrate dehydrogenase [Cupriavidus taiwanensis]SOY94868.1 3-hydroxyisobutyrate dehydrogenase [Cupriavidus taiwanensis]SOZ28243.1 3-hydroxyisobutyrate dehydrogenase [Cupriavidus taiwanensis]SOZ71818.1 3-hydroxyisobutyrate dehydrogenase [Cupriavidus taiwanensis]